jgi:hypothetical protein
MSPIRQAAPKPGHSPDCVIFTGPDPTSSQPFCASMKENQLAPEDGAAQM